MLIMKAKAMAKGDDMGATAALATGEALIENVQLRRHLRAERPTNASPARTSAQRRRKKGRSESMSAAAAPLDRKIEIVKIDKKSPRQSRPR
jgi:hypothetical protein